MPEPQGREGPVALITGGARRIRQMKPQERCLPAAPADLFDGKCVMGLARQVPACELSAA